MGNHFNTSGPKLVLSPTKHLLLVLSMCVGFLSLFPVSAGASVFHLEDSEAEAKKLIAQAWDLMKEADERHCRVERAMMQVGIAKCEDVKGRQEAYRKILPLLMRASELAPKLVDVWCEIGDLHSVLEQFADAEDAYRKALEIDVTNSEALLGVVESKAGKGELDKGLTFADEALSRNPRDENLLAGLLLLLEREKRESDAIPYLRRMIAATASSPDIQGMYEFNLARILWMAEDKFEEAGDVYDKALSKNITQPLHGLGLFQFTRFAEAYGLSLEEERRWSDANALYGKVISKITGTGEDEQVAKFLRFQTANFFNMRDWDNAIKTGRLGVEKDPKDVSTWSILSFVYGYRSIATGGIYAREALSSGRRTLELQPDRQEGIFALGVGLYFSGRLVEAAEQLRILKENGSGLANLLSQLMN